MKTMTFELAVIDGPAIVPVGRWVIEERIASGDCQYWLVTSGGTYQLRSGCRAVRVPDLPPLFELPPPGTTFWAEIDWALNREVAEFCRFSSGGVVHRGGTQWTLQDFRNLNAKLVEKPK